MLYFIRILIISTLNLVLIETMIGKEFLEDTPSYINEICSHNGIPKIDKETKEIICTCEEKYANEPREKYKKYINGHFIQCSYEKKRRFLTFFLAAICPLGLDYFYLGHYLLFSIIFILSIIIVAFNIVSFVLNYKINKKNEEIKRQNKLKKANKKFNFQIITEINDRCVNIFTKVTNVLTLFLIIFWIYNFIIQGLGRNLDINDVPTENDMGYIFQKPEY